MYIGLAVLAFLGSGLFRRWGELFREEGDMYLLVRSALQCLIYG